MCTIQCLRAGCMYRVRARARNTSGYSSYSGASDAQTAPDRPRAPEPPVAAARSASSISVNWAPPKHDGGSAISSYRLELCRGDSTRTTLHAHLMLACTRNDCSGHELIRSQSQACMTLQPATCMHAHRRWDSQAAMLSLRPRMHTSVLQKLHRALLAQQSWRSSSMRWCRWRTMAWTAELTSQTLSPGSITFCVCQLSMPRGRLLPLNQVWSPHTLHAQQAARCNPLQ